MPFWFKDVESLVKYLKAVPWPEKIELEKHWKHINHILAMAQTKQDIGTNEHLGPLIVQKL